jgi:two-component system chemotaxis response regulator CheB
MANNGGRDIIVVGASAGGVEALKVVAAGLDSSFRGSIFIVLHVSPDGPSLLAEILNAAGPLPALHAKDEERVRPGYIYVAWPDYHMKLEPGRIRLVKGPRENRHRPAVDPLFRSAAVTYRERVAGVVLTGALDDGTAGLIAIKRAGGLAIVQNPEDAQQPGMPTSALRNVDVDHVVRLPELAPLLNAVARSPVAARGDGGSRRRRPALAEAEEAFSSMDTDAMETDVHPGKPSVFSCPECSGALWELEESGLLRFRCRVGHAYTADHLAVEQYERLEQALWVALRSLEENVSLLETLVQRARDRGDHTTAERHEEDAEHRRSSAQTIRDLLVRPT